MNGVRAPRITDRRHWSECREGQDRGENQRIRRQPPARSVATPAGAALFDVVGQYFTFLVYIIIIVYNNIKISHARKPSSVV